MDRDAPSLQNGEALSNAGAAAAGGASGSAEGLPLPPPDSTLDLRAPSSLKGRGHVAPQSLDSDTDGDNSSSKQNCHATRHGTRHGQASLPGSLWGCLDGAASGCSGVYRSLDWSKVAGVQSACAAAMQPLAAAYASFQQSCSNWGLLPTWVPQGHTKETSGKEKGGSPKEKALFGVRLKMVLLTVAAAVVACAGYAALWGDATSQEDSWVVRALRSRGAPTEVLGSPSDTCTSFTRTRSGLCISTLFEAYDDVYRDLWPGAVDLLIRTRLNTEEHELGVLFRSIEYMWPLSLGDTVVVLDDDPQNRAAAVFLPKHAKVFFERNELGLQAELQPQWSAMWADNYTTAPFIALADGDLLFVTKVVPSLLFNLTEGVPYLLGINFTMGPDRHYGQWRSSTHYFIGDEHYWANFMVNMPFTVPRTVLPGFRAFVEKRNQKGFDEAVLWWARNGKPDPTRMSYQTLLGNYIRSHGPEKVHLVQENSEHTPIPRCGVHLPLAKPLQQMTAARWSRDPKFNEAEYERAYTAVAANYTREALCEAFPEGEIEFCDEFANGTSSLEAHRVLWAYLYDWPDWKLLYRQQPGDRGNSTLTTSGTVVYDTYKAELHCMYGEYVGRSHSGIPPPAASKPFNCIKTKPSKDVVHRVTTS